MAGEPMDDSQPGIDDLANDAYFPRYGAAVCYTGASTRRTKRKHQFIDELQRTRSIKQSGLWTSGQHHPRHERGFYFLINWVLPAQACVRRQNAQSSSGASKLSGVYIALAIALLI